MRTKVTLFLLFLNVALFFFIYHFQKEWRTEQAFQEATKHVLGPEVATIQSLEIKGRDGRFAEPVRLEKRGDAWWIVRPFEWPANANAIERIITALRLLEHDASFSVKDLAQNNRSLADYGLDKPQIALTFVPAAKTRGTETLPAEPVELKIGDVSQMGNRLYVLSPDGQRVHVVNRSLIESLDLSSDQLRDKTLFSIPSYEVRALNVTTLSPSPLKVRIVREGSKWAFESPILTSANKANVELAINEAQSLQAKSFPNQTSIDTDRTGLANPLFRLTLEGNGRRETLVIGAPAPVSTSAESGAVKTDAEANTADYYARMEDKQGLSRPVTFTVTVPAFVIETLRNAQQNLRETRFFDFDTRAVTSISILAPRRPELTLQRLEGKSLSDKDPWQVLVHSPDDTPAPQPADLRIVQNLVQKLYLLPAVTFVNDAPSSADLENWGFNRPEREITLTFAPSPSLNTKTATSVKLLLAVGNGGQTYAKLSNAPFVYQVETDILKDTPAVARSFRDRNIRELPSNAQITHIKVTDISTNQSLLDEPMVGPGPATEKAASLAMALRNVRAATLEDDHFTAGVVVDGENRPWKYKIEIEISLGTGSTSQTVPSEWFLTERIGGNRQFAGSAEFKVVFGADQKLIDALFAITNASKDPGAATQAMLKPFQ